MQKFLLAFAALIVALLVLPPLYYTVFAELPPELPPPGHMLPITHPLLVADAIRDFAGAVRSF